MGIEENPRGGSVKTCIIGMKRTVTGTLSSNTVPFTDYNRGNMRNLQKKTETSKKWSIG